MEGIMDNRYVQPNIFLKSSECFNEPIDKMSNYLINNDHRKIVVSGGRGVGKSLVLCNTNLKTQHTKQPIMVTSFDSVGLFPKCLNHVFDQKFYSHYYELIMSFKLLRYLKEHSNINHLSERVKHQIILYESKLEEYDRELSEYINNVYSEIDPRLVSYLSTGDIIKELLQKTKDILKADTISIAIDRFDWTNGNKSISQETLSKYFDIFDKAIITADDEDLLDYSNRNHLIRKGYSFIDICYGRNLEIVKEIVKKKVSKSSKNIGDLKFDYNKISDEVYEKLIDKSDGNISLMLHTTGFAYDTFQWECGDWDVNKSFEFALDTELEENKKIRRLVKSPKLYL